MTLETEKISLRIPRSLVKALKAEAGKRGLTLTALAVLLIEKGFFVDFSAAGEAGLSDKNMEEIRDRLAAIEAATKAQNEVRWVAEFCKNLAGLTVHQTDTTGQIVSRAKAAADQKTGGSQ